MKPWLQIKPDHTYAGFGVAVGELSAVDETPAAVGFFAAGETSVAVAAAYGS